jgi:hypothetical protein
VVTHPILVSRNPASGVAGPGCGWSLSGNVESLLFLLTLPSQNGNSYPPLQAQMTSRMTSKTLRLSLPSLQRDTLLCPVHSRLLCMCQYDPSTEYLAHVHIDLRTTPLPSSPSRIPPSPAESRGGHISRFPTEIDIGVRVLNDEKKRTKKK